MRARMFGLAERGAALVVALIMLLLFTLLVSGAFTLSTVNLKAVGNMQVREEALAAANTAIEELLELDFAGTGNQTISVDINKDGTDDYQVAIPAPVCIRVSIAEAAAPSSVNLSALSSDTWNTVWNIEGTATDTISGTSVKVREGVRVLLTDAQKNTHCP
jgi:Tfp pilus assembly protein PilX